MIGTNILQPEPLPSMWKVILFRIWQAEQRDRILSDLEDTRVRHRQRSEALATKIKAADAFVFVTGEYNWGMQPGLKNSTDHYLEEWFWRPAAIASYSAGRLSGVRSSMMWHGTLSEMGIVVISSTLAVGAIADALDVNGVPDRSASRGR